MTSNMIDNALFSQNFIRMHYDEQLGDNVELEQTANQLIAKINEL
jgi:hypothetical protein